MNKYQDVQLNPGFAYVEIYAGYNNGKDGSPLTNKNGFPMCTLSVNVVDKDANVGKKTIWVSSNVTSRIINIESAFRIENFFDSKTSRFSIEKIVGKCAGTVLEADEKYGVNFKTFVPIAFYELLQKRVHDESGYDGVTQYSAKRLLKGDAPREMYTKIDTP